MNDPAALAIGLVLVGLALIGYYVTTRRLR
jgi:hypothetical protein